MLPAIVGLSLCTGTNLIKRRTLGTALNTAANTRHTCELSSREGEITTGTLRTPAPESCEGDVTLRSQPEAEPKATHSGCGGNDYLDHVIKTLSTSQLYTVIQGQ